MEHESKPRRILPAKQVDARTGMTRTQRWNEERSGRFPQRVQITAWRIGYFEDEIDEWIASRPRRGAEITPPRSPGRRGKAGSAA